MNEALKPEVVERDAPAVPKAPVPGTCPSARPRPGASSARDRAGGRAGRRGDFRLAKYRAHSDPDKRRRETGRYGPPPQTVRVAPATLGDMPITIDALGTVTPFETVTVRTQIAGNLTEVGFNEGQILKKGDFLAQIDPRPYQAALAQAKGQLAKDQALLGQAQSDLARYQTARQAGFDRPQQVADQQALVLQDKAAIQTDQASVADGASSTSTTPTSSRRSPAGSGCAWSTPATTCSPPTPPASSSSPRSIRSASSSRRPRTICRHRRAARFRRRAQGHRVRPRQGESWRPGR